MAKITPSTVNRLEVRQVLTGFEKQVNSMAFYPDGHLLASGSNDDTVRLW